MKHSILHKTVYHYDEPVSYALQKVRLHPVSGPGQSVADWQVGVQGGQIEASYRDHYGNHVDLVSADTGTSDLVIEARGEVEVTSSDGVLGKVYTRAPLWHFCSATALTAADEGIEALGKHAADHPGGVLAGLHEMSAQILKQVPYETGATTTDTSAQDAMRLGKGVCQDHSHIFIAAARAAGVPARYVSGYLYMPDRTDQDASHGWAEAHIDGLGWTGFDVSNQISPDEKYIRIAIGCDARDATPIAGMRVGAGASSMIVSLQVQQ
ncbi:MAG: transglutaminase family protein [Pseudomonadota bacterium]